jgi:murein DD-endopeptidase MepM/ murein hydrolase activator NlpD
MAVGCSGDEPSDAVETVRGELSGSEMGQVLGMENPALWSSTTAQLSSSAIRVQGNASLAVRATNYNFIDSIPLTQFTLVNNTVQFSIRLPTQQPNPFWFGDVQMFVNAPSVGLFNQYVGYVGLTGKPLNQFTTITMTLPQNIVQGLSGPFSDLVIRLVLNVPSNATGTYLFDNLVFGGVSAANLGALGPIDMTVEPTESGKIVYLPLAPASEGGTSVGQFTLDVSFRNTGTTLATIDTFTVSFSGGPAVPPRTYVINLSISPGDTQHFLWGHDQTILLPQPAPTSVTFQAHATNVASPAAMTRALVAHVSPVAGGAWSWPSDAADLAPGQFWNAASTFHNPGLAQGFALDMGVVQFDEAAGDWRQNKPGTDGTENNHWWSYGKPVRAMADGEVAAFHDGLPENSPTCFAYPSGQCQLFCNLFPTDPECTNGVGSEGNAFFIRSGPEWMLYAHLQAGSLPAELKMVGAHVTKGQILGLSGNNGNSSNPHLHIHAARTTVPQGGSLMPFKDVWMIGQSFNTPPNANAPWVFVQGKGVPEVGTLIFPSTTHP